jgi:flagellar M-ring protein FliF
MALLPASNIDQLKASARRFASGFTRGQKAVTLAALVGVVVVAGLFMTLSGRPTYSILFSNLQPTDAASITQKLVTDHVPYQLQDGGATILVPQNDVDQERLAAAQLGLPASSTVGLSLLDKEGLTTSQLTQQADYLQALQGELESTINSISGVQSSQVNVAMAANQTFALGTNSPTGASVLVDLTPGHTLTYDQTQAITSLVASSVAGLDASQVTVADSNGDLLAGPGVSNTGGEQSSAESAYDAAGAARISAYLAAVLGAGNADVQVNANLNFDQVKTDTQSLINGSNGKPETACTSTQKSATHYTGTGTPPGSSVGATTSSGNGTYTQTSTQSTCETGTVNSTTVQAPGTVTTQSVAVLVNSKAVPKSLQLSALKAGVAAAAGIKTSRGDVLAFSAAAFPATETTTAKAAAPAPLTTLMKPALSVLLLVLVLFLLWRASRKGRRTSGGGEPAMLGALGAFELGGGGSYDERPTGELPVMRPLAVGPGGSVQAIVDSQSDEVATVLRGWLEDRPA